jgi:DNA polymerase-1
MRHLTFGQEEKTKFKICILVNEIRKDEIHKAYIKPYGLDPEDILVLNLHVDSKKKHTPVKEIKAYIQEELTPVLAEAEVEYLIVTNGDYFKTLTGKVNIDKTFGYMLDTKYGPWKVVYAPNYRAIFFDPVKVTSRISAGMYALTSWLNGTYVDPGVDIIKYRRDITTIEDAEFYLWALIKNPRPITVDIEAFSLKHFSAGIGSISFAWNKSEGMAIAVDIINDPEYNIKIRALLKDFFINYKEKLIFHKIDYDVTVLIFQLFMKDLLDNVGLLYGLSIMLRDWDCTRLITYLATNSCAGNDLRLKIQAQEYAGDYAVDEIKNIRAIPLPQLLQYNLVDALSTWFVYDKHYPRMIADNQLDVYENIFKPAMVDIIQMQLTGMPVDRTRVEEVRKILEIENERTINIMNQNLTVQELVYDMTEELVDQKNAEYKKKVIAFEDVEVEFNPNSGAQLIRLLYGRMGLPILVRTETGLPSTDADTLEALLNHTTNPKTLEFLQALIDYTAVSKILTTTIPALESAVIGPDGWSYLFGNFNLGGTVSGRLSSSDPNLQNLPAKEGYSKLIKSCFKAPEGWFFCGIDFNSLEDRISALTTKDPNKLKVYTDGYDGHALRAVAYFGEHMPDIDPTDVNSVNSVAKKGNKYEHYRQDSKVPTFALTYDGTWRTLMTGSGFSKEKALKVEAAYHELYQVSDKWVADKLDQACIDGFVTVAFGLRVRTPLLKQVVRGTSRTPYEAQAEGRTAGNALGQSWCLLNSRAASEFMNGVRTSEFKHSIKPCAQIHDAQYYLVKDEQAIVQYANDHVVKACQWQDHPDIWHDEVKLGGEFSIFWPDWSSECVLPNEATQTEINLAFKQHLAKLREKIPK